jgi:hypothetical protein
MFLSDAAIITKLGRIRSPDRDSFGVRSHATSLQETRLAGQKSDFSRGKNFIIQYSTLDVAVNNRFHLGISDIELRISNYEVGEVSEEAA